MNQTTSAAERRKITRPVVSDQDGTREAGLVFPIAVILAIVVASFAHPMALTSFWVWVALLMLAVALSAATQRMVARWNGFDEETGEGEAG